MKKFFPLKHFPEKERGKTQFVSIVTEIKDGVTTCDIHFGANSIRSNSFGQKLAIQADGDSFHTGIFDLNDEFHRTPIQIGCVRFSSITTLVHEKKEEYQGPNHKYRYLSDVECFEKENVESGEIEVVKTTLQYTEDEWGVGRKNSPTFHSARYISEAINMLNLYIKKRGDLTAIQPRYRWDEFFKIADIRMSSLPPSIELLSAQFFSNSRDKGPGKDTNFWTEVVLSNIPKSEHLRHCFLEIIKRSFSSDARIADDTIIVEYDKDYAYCRAEPREETKHDPAVVAKIKTALLLNIASRVDLDQLRCDMIANLSGIEQD